jgi:hypothetical protein
MHPILGQTRTSLVFGVLVKHIYIYLLRTVSAWLHLFLGVSVARLPSAAIVSWPCAGVSQPTCAGYLRMISHGIKVLELSNVVSYHDLIPICF